MPKKKVNQDLRLSNEKGDFIVISRTFFFYPNLVWILNFLFFKEKFPTTALFLRQLGRSPMDRALASHHESRGSNPGANKCHAQVR